MDRSFWRVIANDENALPQGEWVAELTPELLGWLGSTDPELRDEFAYRILAAWIERGQYGADPAATVHVGDQPANDVAAARAVGITPVLIDRFGRHPGAPGTHRVEDLHGLVRLLDRPG